MSEKIKHSDQLDDFSKAIQQALDNHRMQVDADCWTKIEQGLQPHPKKKYWLFSIPATVAAAVAILFVLVNTNDDTTTINQLAKKEVSYSDKRINTDTEKDNISFGQEKLTAQSSKPTKASNVQPQTSISNRKDVKENNEKEKIQTPQELINDKNDLIAKKGDQNTENNETQKGEDQLLTPEQIDEELNKYIATQKSKGKSNGWQLAFAAGSGDNMITQDEDDIRPKASAVMLNTSKTKTFRENQLSPSDFDDVSYNVPLSFGFYVRKNISNNVSIESGLIYSYLSTHFKNPKAKINGKRIEDAEADLRLHYLGVPLNLSASIWNNKNWNIYISAGGMIEKGLRADFKQTKITNTKELKASAETEIKGFQYSLNAAAGASFKLAERWHLYAEPKLSYYFDNEQPISIRTERTFIFGLNGGIRYEF